MTSQSLCSLSVNLRLVVLGTSGKRFTGFCGVLVTTAGLLIPDRSDLALCGDSARLGSSPFGAGRMLFNQTLVVLDVPSVPFNALKVNCV